MGDMMAFAVQNRDATVKGRRPLRQLWQNALATAAAIALGMTTVIVGTSAAYADDPVDTATQSVVVEVFSAQKLTTQPPAATDVSDGAVCEVDEALSWRTAQSAIGAAGSTPV